MKIVDRDAKAVLNWDSDVKIGLINASYIVCHDLRLLYYMAEVAACFDM